MFNDVVTSKPKFTARVLRCLVDGPRSCAEVARALGVGRGGDVSAAMSVLEEAGFAAPECTRTPETGEEHRERRELQPDRGREGAQGAMVDVDADGVDAAEEDLRIPAERGGDRRADRERRREQQPRGRLLREARRKALHPRHGTEQRRPDAVHQQVVEAVLDEARGQVDPAEEQDEGEVRRHADESTARRCGPRRA